MPRAVLTGQLAAIALVLSSSPALASQPAVVVHVDRSRPAITVATADHQLHVARGPAQSLGRGHRVALSLPARTVSRRSGRAGEVTFAAVVERSRLRMTPRVSVPLSGVDRVVGPALEVGEEVAVTWTLSATGVVRTTKVARPKPRGGAATAPAPAPTPTPAPTTAPAPTATPTPAPTTAPAPTPTATPEPAPAPAPLLLFEDRFDHPAGSAADTSKWVPRGEVCDTTLAYSCSRNANVFHDGEGNLVLRAKREPGGHLGQPYSSAFLGTFQYGWGWPPPNVKAGFSVPFRIEVRALMPDSPGLWPIVWPMNVDRSRAERIHELDMVEQRMARPTEAGCHQHTWLNGADLGAWDGLRTVTHTGRNWHTYSADVRADRVEYRVDGELCGVAPGVTGRFGILVSNWVAKPGTWGSAGAQPAATDPGPWDMKVDHVRVTAG